MNQVDVPFLLPWYVHRLAEASCAINHHVAMGLNNGLMLVYLQKHLGTLLKDIVFINRSMLAILFIDFYLRSSDDR